MRDQEETEFVRLRLLPHDNGDLWCEKIMRREIVDADSLAHRFTAGQTTSAVTPKANSVLFFQDPPENLAFTHS